MKKRLLTIVLATMMVSTMLAGCGTKKTENKNSEKPAELKKVTVTEFRGVTWAPMYIAYQLGYFKDEGIDLQLTCIKSGPDCFKSMHTGDSQFCILSQEVSLKAQEQNQNSTVLATMLDTRYYSLVATPEIKSVADLKGKTAYASTPGSAPYTFCTSILEEAGLKVGSDVTLVTLDKGAVVAALQKGEIQAAFINADNFREVENVDGLHYLVDTRNSDDAKRYLQSDIFPGEVILCTEKYKKENPETVQAFVNATCKGINWLSEHTSAEAADVISELFSGMTKEILADKIEIMRGAFSKNGYVTEAGEKAVIDFTKRTGIITTDFKYEDVVDMSFINNAIKAGYVPAN